MSGDALRKELESAIERDESFGPAGNDDSLREISAAILRQVILSSSADDDGAKRLRLRRVRVAGELDLEAQRIGLRLQLNDCELTGDLNLSQCQAFDIALMNCELKGALNGSQLELRWNLRLNDSKVSYGVWLIGAKIGGQLSMESTELSGIPGADGTMEPALTADGVEVSGDTFCEDMSSKGAVRLLGAKIGGGLSMVKAELKGMPGTDGEIEPALNASRIEVSENMFCEEMSSEGEVRLLGAKIEGELSMVKAELKGMPGTDGEIEPALEVSRGKVGGELRLEEMTSEGAVRLVGAKIGGQLDLTKARLTPKGPTKDCLLLISTEIDELILAFDGVAGVVNLTDTKVRSLWDAKEGKFLGKFPEILCLQGFHYESLREPLSAEQRLEWIECSQREQHYPEVYAELAEAYRRIGLRPDARAVGIANERRAREDGTLVKKLWSYLLWKFVRYGYENWRAVVGLLAVIAVGSLVFWVAHHDFVAKVTDPPNLSPVIYATDAAIPVLDLGQTSTWAATGGLEWVELVLAIFGYALVGAVIAGLAGIFKRDQV